MNYSQEDEYQKHIDAMFIEEQEDDEEYLTQHWLFNVKKKHDHKTFNSIKDLMNDLQGEE